MKLLAGGAAGAAAQAAVYPLDTLKTRVQTHYLSHHVPAAAAGATLQGAALTARTAHAPPSLPALAGSMLQTEGVGAFYRGLGPSLLGIIPYAAIDLTLYETLKSAAASWSPLQQQESGEAPQKAITILPRGPREQLCQFVLGLPCCVPSMWEILRRLHGLKPMWTLIIPCRSWRGPVVECASREVFESPGVVVADGLCVQGLRRKWCSSSAGQCRGQWAPWRCSPCRSFELGEATSRSPLPSIPSPPEQGEKGPRAQAVPPIIGTEEYLSK